MHFNELRLALAPWAQHAAHVPHKAADYAGPWIENHFIGKFEGMYDTSSSSSNRNCLSDLFGSYIPLFVPWVDLWVDNSWSYPPGLVQTLERVLRPDVAYVTVS